MFDSTNQQPVDTTDEDGDFEEFGSLDDLDVADACEARGPYEAAALAYIDRGWSPIPIRVDHDGGKRPAVQGVTGRTGEMVSAADAQAFIDEGAVVKGARGSFRTGPLAAHSVAVRVPRTVIGIDVDAYGEKRGAATMARWEAEHGVLPGTVMTTSRGFGASGIRLFSVPVLAEGREWRGDLRVEGKAGDVEVVRFEHRYAMAAPSVHPRTGDVYCWYGPDGAVLTVAGLPRPEELPALPQAWVDALSHDHVGEFEVAEWVGGDAAGLPPVAKEKAQEIRGRILARLRDMRDRAAAGRGGSDQWDNVVFGAACDLVKLANAGWNTYTVQAARSDLLRWAPTDAGFGQDRVLGKWESAFRRYGSTQMAAPEVVVLAAAAADPELRELAIANGLLDEDDFAPAPVAEALSPVEAPAVAEVPVVPAAGSEPVEVPSAPVVEDFPVDPFVGQKRDVYAGPRSFDELFDETVEALLSYDGDSPSIFWSWPTLQYVDLTNSTPQVVDFTIDTLRIAVARRVNFFVMKKGAEGVMERMSVKPDDALLKSLKAGGTRFPECRAVSATGFFTPSGEWWDRKGYCREAATYCTGQVVSDPIPAAPTRADVVAAAELVWEPLAEFPYVETASGTHALALAVLPFVRAMIEEATPLHMAEASVPGTGKTKLLMTALFPSCGDATLRTVPNKDDELQKTVFSALRNSPKSVVLDNLDNESTFGSGEFSGIVTSYPKYSSRVYGTSTDATVSTAIAWAATANSPSYTSEVARRTVTIHLDAGPNVLGRTFQIEDLKGWVETNRGRLISAWATIVRGWILAGRPMFTGKPLASFEKWSRVVGGILEFAGFSGFLANHEVAMTRTDGQRSMLGELVAAWADRADTSLSSDEILQLADGLDIQLPGVAGATPEQRKTKLGWYLRKNVTGQRLPGGYTVSKGSHPQTRTAVYDLVRCAE